MAAKKELTANATTEKEYEYFITPLGKAKAPLYGIYAGLGPLCLTLEEGASGEALEVQTKATPSSPKGKMIFPVATQEQLKVLYEEDRFGGKGQFHGYIGKREKTT